MTFSRAVIPARPLRLRSGIFLSLQLFFALSFSLALTPGTFAQDSGIIPSDEVIKINTDLVTVPVVVADERGRRVSGFGEGDFAVSDEGRPVRLAYFATGAERVALTFLLDASGSAVDIVARQSETARALVSRFGSRSRVAVFHFRERPELVVPFTDDPLVAVAGFDIPVRPNRRTAIFDAALAAVRSFESKTSHPTERRIVILISDGLDTASTVPASLAIGEAEARGVSFYIIHLPLYTPRDGRLVARPTAKGFRQLAEQTGGRFFTVGNAQTSLDPNARYDLGPIFSAVADDLQGQYLLGYYLDSALRNQGSRRVQVNLVSPRRSKFRVRVLREWYELRDR